MQSYCTECKLQNKLVSFNCEDCQTKIEIKQTSFYKRKTLKCKQCLSKNRINNSKWTSEYRKEYDKSYSIENRKELYLKQQDRLNDNRSWFIEYKKNLKCSKCPENHPAVLHFHHLRDKITEVSVMVGQGFSKDKILKEIEKCIVLCANCHYKHHFNTKPGH